MAIHDLSVDQLENLVKRLKATSQAYQEAELYPPPQIQRELARAINIYESKKIPPKPDPSLTYEELLSETERLPEEWSEYMDGTFPDVELYHLIDMLIDRAAQLKKQVYELEQWNQKYK
jgi:hypothetical protein